MVHVSYHGHVADVGPLAHDLTNLQTTVNVYVSEFAISLVSVRRGIYLDSTGILLSIL